MLRAVYYARVSTEHELQLNALKNQIETLEEYIKNKQDWTFVRGYVDEGKTATTVHGRHDYQKLIVDMRNNEFDVVVIIRVDRGWRNDRDWAQFETELILTKVRLFTVTNHSYFDFRDSGNWLQVGIEAKLAELFSRQQSIKMTEAFARGKKKGKIYGNSRIWGYDYVNGALVINDQEKKLVEYVFHRYADGVGFRTIAKELYDKGYYNLGTKDRLFPLTTLKRMIRNPKYIGVLVTNKTRFDFFEKRQYRLPESDWLTFKDRVPAIIDSDLFRRANEMLKLKSNYKPDKDKVYGQYQGSYSLSKKIWCAKCEKPYYFNKSTKKGIRSTWYCSTYRMWGAKKENRGCDNSKIPVVEMDQMVKHAIFQLWDGKDLSKVNLLTAIQTSIQSCKKKAQKDVQKNRTRLNELQCLKRNMRQLLYKGLISEADYLEDVNVLDTEIIELAKYLVEIDVQQNNCDDARLVAINDFLTRTMDSIECISDDMVKSLVNKITVFDNEITLEIQHKKIITCWDAPKKKEETFLANETPASLVNLNIIYPYVSATGPHGHTGGSGSGGV